MPSSWNGKNHFHLCGRELDQIGALERFKRDSHSLGHFWSMVASTPGEERIFFQFFSSSFFFLTEFFFPQRITDTLFNFYFLLSLFLFCSIRRTQWQSPQSIYRWLVRLSLPRRCNLLITPLASCSLLCFAMGNSSLAPAIRQISQTTGSVGAFQHQLLSPN